MNEREIFQTALDYSDLAQRQAYLEQACGKDAAIRARIEALLCSHDSESQFLQVPAAEQLKSPGDRPTQTMNFDEDQGDEHLDDESAARPDLSFLTPSSRSGSLGILGHYEILQLLGQGAFGLVFKAFDEKLQRHVAIKVMNPQLAATSPPRKRFLREARSAAAIKHENIVQVYSVEEQPLPYLVMEYVDGQTLQSKLDRSGPLDVAEILHLGRQMANGLAAAHAQGLIHRDIKPGNILIEAGTEQKVKITDFGLARAADDATITRTGVISGTPMYMAPEQAQGLALDHRADLFSLGSVLYQMACGRPPFRGANAIAVLKRVTDEVPRPIQEIIPEVPDRLCEIISQLHAKNPEERFQSAKDFAELLARCQTRVQQSGRVDLPNEVAPFMQLPAVVTKPHPKDSKASLGKPAVLPKLRRWAAAAVVVLVLLAGLSMTEARGITNMRGTIIRLFSPDGTLIVEVDDPDVSVSIDGEDMVITGAGAKEIRLKPGRYKVLASKDGKLVSQEVVTVTKNGRQVVRVSRESPAIVDAKPPMKVDLRPKVQSGGEWRIEGTELVQVLPQGAFLMFGDPGWSDYIVEVEGLTSSTTREVNGFRTIFRAQNPDNHRMFDIGNYAGTITDACYFKQGTWGRTPGCLLRTPFENDRWYKIKVEVNGPAVRCSVDGKLTFAFSDADLTTGMIGLASGGSPTRWRNLKVTAPDGRVLWEGFPDLGPAAPSTDPDRRAAEWVLANGGKVQIAPGGYVVSLDKLPTHKFTIGLISFDGLKFKEESELKCLAQLAHLEQVFLGQAPITGLGLGYFATCPEIAVLALDSTAVRDRDLGVLKNLKKLQNLTLHNTRTTDAAIEHIFECPRLTQLDLSLTGITDAGLKKLEELKGLQFIQVYQTKVSAEGVKKFAAALPGCKIRWDGGVIEPKLPSDPDRRAAEFILSFPRTYQIAVQVNDIDRWIGKVSDLPAGPFRLTGVGVEWAPKLDDEGLANFAGCKHVKILNLVGTQVTAKGLVHFKDCQDLQELSLVGDFITDSALEIFKGRKLKRLGIRSNKITDAGLAHFQGSNLLTSLDLAHCPVTDQGIAYFKDNRKLKTLSLAATNVSDAGLAHFKDCKDLESLSLFWTRVSDDGLAHFKECKKLKMIDLGRLSLVSDKGLANFTDCADLEQLALGGTSVGDDGLSHLKNMKNLAFLGLQSTKVTDAGLVHLKECKLLGELHLWQTRVTGTGFVHLSELPNLSRLFLAECPVTDESINSLCACVKLRSLGLTKTRVSEAGVKKLHTALPQCQIESDHGKFGPGIK